MLSVLLLRVLPGSQAMPAAVLVLLIAGAAAILPISGRTPDEWLPVVAGTFTARLRGEHRYRARRASQGFTSALDGEALKRPQSMPPVLRGCRLLSAHSPTAASWECSRTQSWARTRTSSSCTHAPGVCSLRPSMSDGSSRSRTV